MSDELTDRPQFFEVIEDATGDKPRYAVVRWDTWRGSAAHRQGMPETIAYFPCSALGRKLADEHCRQIEAAQQYQKNQ